MEVPPRADNKIAYHLAEFAIAQNPSDPRHLLPSAAPDGSRVLDIGCGAGQTLRAAFGNCAAFGVDVDRDALLYGHEWNPEVHFAAARAEALPFKDQSFDLVVARVSLQYCDLSASLQEIRRVLRPGGSVWMALQTAENCVTQARQGGWKGWLYFAYICVNSALLAWFGKQFNLGGRQETFQTAGGMRRMLGRLEFMNTVVEHGRHFVVTASRPR